MGYLEQYKDSQHVGETKERLEFNVKVTRIFLHENEFGQKRIHHMVTDDGNYLVWFCSSTGLEQDYEGRIKATIKDHVEYKGVKQTIVNRVSKIKNNLIKPNENN